MIKKSPKNTPIKTNSINIPNTPKIQQQKISQNVPTFPHKIPKISPKVTDPINRILIISSLFSLLDCYNTRTKYKSRINMTKKSPKNELKMHQTICICVNRYSKGFSNRFPNKFWDRITINIFVICFRKTI